MGIRRGRIQIRAEYSSSRFTSRSRTGQAAEMQQRVAAAKSSGGLSTGPPLPLIAIGLAERGGRGLHFTAQGRDRTMSRTSTHQPLSAVHVVFARR
jgi:hypothetical protein